MKKLFLSENWKLNFEEKTIPSQVPGDITIDLFNAGLVSNPYVAENYKDSTWVGHKDFVYSNEFKISENDLKSECIDIVFKGIDLYAAIYLNDQLIGKTQNAFREYRFDVKPFLKEGNNVLKVEMTSTIETMEKFDQRGYFSIFNDKRIFIRKPQCHFGWDWAPKICAYGIIDVVYLEMKNKHQILNVNPIADNKGNVIFTVEINYDNKPFFGPGGVVLQEAEEPKEDIINFYVAKTPFEKDYGKYSIPMMGKKNFYAYHTDDFKLWWPTGYGEQPLYNYRIELVRDGEIKDSFEGRFGFRSVRLVEEPKPGNLIGMEFYINDKPIYLKGSNWVPPECFTGVMKDEKYYSLIKLAKDMNANMLRVWGGGSYEKDIFYDICDELGILVWQDIAFACADIPEEIPEFMDEVIKEVTYQVKRLRVHPSLIYWCGGNEKTGCYGNCVTHGDFLVNNVLYGVVKHLDDTRPYRRQSPHSFTDIGNNPTSGDSHHGNSESALLFGMKNYRSHVAEKVVPFVSECAVMGPSSVEALKNIFPSDHIWPMDEMWKDRFMENPYGSVPLDFPHREKFYAEDLYGEVSGLEDFVRKAMASQAESLRAEGEFSRAHRGTTGAFLNWMFDDIWPSGTWSIIDYSLEPKQAYYQLKKSFKPLLVSFYEDSNGLTHLFIDNQSFNDFKGKVQYGVKTYDGNILLNEEVDAIASFEKGFDIAINFDTKRDDIYLFAKYNDEETLYSPSMYASSSWNGKFTYDVKVIDSKKIELEITAIDFVRALFIHFPENYHYQYSDNYLDIEKGAKAKIVITSDIEIDTKAILFNY